MLNRNKRLQRIVAISIVFLLTLTEFLPVVGNVVFAAEKPEDAVKIKGYFSSESVEETESLVCDASDDSVRINFEIGLEQNGYLKGGTLSFKNYLNFEIKDDENEDIQIKNDEIKLKTISKDKGERISIPVEFKRTDILELAYIKNINKIIFSGIYVDNKAEEHKIEKEINLELLWKEETNTTVECKLIKNIDYELEETKGKIVQTVIRVFGEKEKNNIPVRGSVIKTAIPQIPGMELQEVKVHTDRLAYTQGREDYNIDFSDENYEINEFDELVINTLNNDEDGKLYNSYGEDLYTVTYIYIGEKTSDEIITKDIDFSINNYSDFEEKKSTSMEYELNTAVGDIVQYSKEDKQTDISKGYLMANSELEKYEITYDKKDILNISRADLLDSLEIVDKNEYFACRSDESMHATENENGAMSIYKSTEFSRENLVSILGEQGRIQILNMNDEVVAEVVLEEQLSEDGSILVEYSTPISKIKIRTTKPINDGNISILSKKVIKRIGYSREVVRDFYKLVNVSEAFATYVEGARDSLGEATNVVNITDTISSASLEIAQTELSTTVKNEGINFKIRLNNNEDISDLYENPVFEIRLPRAIREIKIRNIDLFYTNGELEIANVENFEDDGFIIVRVTLKGLQTSYNLNKETNGTIISFDVDMSLDEFTGNITENAELCYYNSLATAYEAEIDWNMFIPSEGIAYQKNGSYIVPLSYKAPEGLVNGQTTETKEPTVVNPVEPIINNEDNNGSGENKVTSVNQGAQSELIEENGPAKLATMFISVMNNSSKSYSNFQILGRVPFTGNKDILTGRDLGTTVDTVLDSPITTEDSELLYTVYYSENGEATNDIDDEANGWDTDYYKMGAVKSYLILLNSDYVLEPNVTLEFSYDYVIPAGLTSGDAFYGTYATYYNEGVATDDKSGQSSSSADEIGYKTPGKAVLEASIDLVQDKIYELSDAEFELYITNVSDEDANNVVIELPMINGLFPSYVRADEDLTADMENNIVRINSDEIKAHDEKRIFVGYNTFRMSNDLETVHTSVTAKADNADAVTKETDAYSIEKAKYSIIETGIDKEKIVGTPTECESTIVNISENNLNNFVFTKKLSKEISVTDISVVGRDDASASYDQDTGLMTVLLPNVNVSEVVKVKYTVTLNRGDLKGNEFVVDSVTTCSSDENNNISYESKVAFYLPDLSIRLINPNDIGYIARDEKIEYKYEIKNNTKFDLYGLKMMLEKSENIDAEVLEISAGEKKVGTANVDSIDKAISMALKAGESATVTIKAKADEAGRGTAYARLKMTTLGEEFTSSTDYSVIEDSDELNNFELTGCAYIDDNKNQQQDDAEEVLSGVIVDLFNSETNEKVGSTITDVSGRYAFRELENGQYYAKFNYDDNNYVLSSKESDTLLQNQSNVISVNDSYMTDNISINNRSVSNVDLELSNDNIFDMKIDAEIEKMTIQNNAENSTFNQENSKLAKVDIDPKLVEGSKVFIEYVVTVRNQGTVPGKVTKIVDYMTGDLEFDSSINPDWYMESDGNVYTRVLDRDEIAPGDSRELRLILIKNVTEDNTGLVHNMFEIADAINDRAIPDIDSTPGNQIDGEDDLSYADAIIGVSTGLAIGTLPVVLVAIVAFIPLAVLVWRIIEKRRYV